MIGNVASKLVKHRQEVINKYANENSTSFLNSKWLREHIDIYFDIIFFPDVLLLDAVMLIGLEDRNATFAEHKNLQKWNKEVV